MKLGACALALFVVAACTSGSSGSKSAQIVPLASGFTAPTGLAADSRGNIYVADAGTDSVKKIDTHGVVTTVAGRGTPGFSGDGGPAPAAELASPSGVAVDSHDNLYIVDRVNNRVRRVDTRGRITTVAGNGQAGFGADGAPATASPLNPYTVAVGGKDVLFIGSPQRVQKLDERGRLTTVAGGGQRPQDVDGAPATDVDLEEVTAIAAAPDGTLYIVQQTANRVQRVSSGKVSTVVGSPPGGTVENGITVTGALHAPAGVATDRAGRLYITETAPGNISERPGQIRLIDSKGQLRTLARGGSLRPSGGANPDAPAPVNAAALSDPGPIAVAPSGKVVVAEGSGGRIRQLPAGASDAALFAAGPGKPTVTGLAPAQGGTRGLTSVVIAGETFSASPPPTVQFGSRPAHVLRTETGSVLVLVPPGKVGETVDVVLRTPEGRSRPSPASRFTYVDTWEPVAPIPKAINDHTATLLDPPACHTPGGAPGYPCGDVLVVGGTQGFCITCNEADERTVALYNPARDQWTPAADLPAGRMSHTATLLPDGRVLVAGGKARGEEHPGSEELPSAVGTAELYDPVSGTWSATGTMATDRFAHTATLLDAPDCRGPEAPRWCGKVLVAGGAWREEVRDPIASAELWDPVTGQWSPAGSLSEARGNHTASLLPDGRVLVAAGYGDSGGDKNNPRDRVLSSVEIYEPRTNSWSAGPPMAMQRFAHTATTLPGGQVLVVGGNGSRGITDFVRSAELYDPTTSRWQAVPSPRAGRANHLAVLLPNGHVLVAGGGPPFEDGVFRPDSIASAELYDPGTNRWSPTRPLNTARTLATGTVLDGPACRAPAPARYCGAVLAVSGGGTTNDPKAQDSPVGVDTSELYR